MMCVTIFSWSQKWSLLWTPKWHQTPWLGNISYSKQVQRVEKIVKCTQKHLRTLIGNLCLTWKSLNIKPYSWCNWDRNKCCTFYAHKGVGNKTVVGAFSGPCDCGWPINCNTQQDSLAQRNGPLVLVIVLSWCFLAYRPGIYKESLLVTWSNIFTNVKSDDKCF